MQEETTRRVTVWGKRYTVAVYQQAKSRWVATGEYNGETFEVKDRTANSAVRLWQHAAEFKGQLPNPPGVKASADQTMSGSRR